MTSVIASNDVSRETLLAEAEAREKRLEHVLDSGPAGQTVERRSRSPQVLGKDDQVRRLPGVAKGIRRVTNVHRLPAVERKRIFARNQLLGLLKQPFEQFLDAFSGNRRDPQRPCRRLPSLGQVGFRMHPDQPRMWIISEVHPEKADKTV